MNASAPNLPDEQPPTSTAELIQLQQAAIRNTLPRTALVTRPLERLMPLIQSSTFRAPERFSKDESEYVLRADDILISATDTRGKITFANDCFYRISEFDDGELTGASHNVIRHPDMPRTAFADMWSVIKSGAMWQGYIANRAKSGTRYWVKASVFPCHRDDDIVGFISIRTPPEPDDVQRAIEAYRQLP